MKLPQRKKARSESKNGVRVRRSERVPPSQLPDQHEKNQASAGAGADQALNATKATSTPRQDKPAVVEGGADQGLDTTKAPPTPRQDKPAAVEAGADQALDTTKAPTTTPPDKAAAVEGPARYGKHRQRRLRPSRCRPSARYGKGTANAVSVRTNGAGAALSCQAREAQRQYAACAALQLRP